MRLDFREEVPDVATSLEFFDRCTIVFILALAVQNLLQLLLTVEFLLCSALFPLQLLGSDPGQPATSLLGLCWGCKLILIFFILFLATISDGFGCRTHRRMHDILLHIFEGLLSLLDLLLLLLNLYTLHEVVGCTFQALTIHLDDWEVITYLHL